MTSRILKCLFYCKKFWNPDIQEEIEIKRGAFTGSGKYNHFQK